ncbi:MPH6-like protein [Mya arenaria]|uniref:MPH6-like protein n=1 Tax=Mya arenaria TaxID=6604 RepID=A0ABY7ERC8_MYAAR|nr:MPH6-like protein [Mya arenaria]WAR11706.1 MPH6-like protein [Mya arenaria]
MARDESKTSLSGNFMKRSALRIEKEKSEEERKLIIDDEHWVLDLPKIEGKESKYVIESSIARCENLLFGRMSFQGCNPEVEKLMKLHNNQLALDEAERKENENSVNDQEMAERYSTLVGTMAKKFSKKRDRTSVEMSQQEAPTSNI